jgi:small neutral amino acid transporter SnatA (MarC family)
VQRGRLALVLLAALVVTLLTFWAGRRIAVWLGARGLNALEKLTRCATSPAVQGGEG